MTTFSLPSEDLRIYEKKSNDLPHPWIGLLPRQCMKNLTGTPRPCLAVRRTLKGNVSVSRNAPHKVTASVGCLLCIYMLLTQATKHYLPKKINNKKKKQHSYFQTGAHKGKSTGISWNLDYKLVI